MESCQDEGLKADLIHGTVWGIKVADTMHAPALPLAFVRSHVWPRVCSQPMLRASLASHIACCQACIILGMKHAA